MDKSTPLDILEIDNSISKILELIMDDPDAPGGKEFVHWIMWNLELVSILPEDIPKTLSLSFPIGALLGINNFERIGYSGHALRQGRHTATTSKSMGST